MIRILSIVGFCYSLMDKIKIFIESLDMMTGGNSWIRGNSKFVKIKNVFFTKLWF